MPGRGPWGFKIILTDCSYLSGLSFLLKSALVWLSWAFGAIAVGTAWLHAASHAVRCVCRARISWLAAVYLAMLRRVECRGPTGWLWSVKQLVYLAPASGVARGVMLRCAVRLL
jgi:hypothetical protein